MELNKLISFIEQTGRFTTKGVAEIGFGASLMWKSIYWIFMGKKREQTVRSSSVFAQMMEMGVCAVPIITVMNATIGIMMALQGIYSLKMFGAESQVVIGVAFSVVREFAPLITAILVAGRSGSALAAKLGTMTINQEIDALNVMGINPVRYLVAPSFIALLIMLPILTFWADVVGLLAAGLYICVELGFTMNVYVDQVFEVLSVDDLMHGLGKSVLFAVLIVLIGVVNGASVTGGAEGVGRMTTRSVVHGISAIVIADMIFVFMLTR